MKELFNVTDAHGKVAAAFENKVDAKNARDTLNDGHPDENGNLPGPYRVRFGKDHWRFNITKRSGFTVKSQNQKRKIRA